MALLASAWFLIESFLIPDGFVKWFYLSFYINPIFLVFCQIFLWLKNWILVITHYSVRISSYVFSFFRNCVIYVFSFTRLANNDHGASNDPEEVENFEIVPRCNKNQVVFFHQVVFSYSLSTVASTPRQVFFFNIEKDWFEVESYFKDHDEDDHEFSCSDDKDKNALIINEKALVLFNKTDHEEDDAISCHGHDNMEEQIGLSLNYEDTSRISDFSSINVKLNDEHIPFFRRSIPPLAEDSPSDYGYSSVVYVTNSPAVDDFDMNYEYPSAHFSSNLPAKEDEDMNYENSLLVYSSNSAVEDDHVTEYSSIVCGSVSPDVVQARNGSKDHVDEFYKNYTEQMRWFDVLNFDRRYGISAVLSERVSTGKSGRRRLLKNFESDLELVYVAQSCLSWEALHHGYRKMETLLQKRGDVIFCNDVASEFQNFQILLERFMEDEMCELQEKRVLNYVGRRSFLKNLLQVPKVPEFVEEERKGEAVNDGRDVLRAIEKCIQTFWNFVKTDNKLKPWWKLRNSFWTYCPPVEHPRDLKLLADLTTNLQKKELLLRDARGKQKCWIRKVVRPTIEDDERKEVLFTMIEMKLISRVLQMSVVSSSHLKWCQQKLENIDFKHGKTFRTSTHHGLLFPS